MGENLSFARELNPDRDYVSSTANLGKQLICKCILQWTVHIKSKKKKVKERIFSEIVPIHADNSDAGLLFFFFFVDLTNNV